MSCVSAKLACNGMAARSSLGETVAKYCQPAPCGENISASQAMKMSASWRRRIGNGAASA